MVGRALLRAVEEGIESDGCALLVGPYEVGKTELALEIQRRYGGDGLYFNARKQGDRHGLAGDNGAASNSAGKLIVVDEIHDFIDALDLIHAEIDAGRYQGKTVGRFLLLGSLSLEAERLAATKLGTRARVYRLSPIDLLELSERHPDTEDARTLPPIEPEATTPIHRSSIAISLETLWLRGGFPASLLANRDDTSYAWRETYLNALCARGYSHLDPALAMSSVRNFLERIAALQGETLDVNSLPRAQRPCLAYFEDLGLIRQLRPWFSNQGKRLEKPHKVYIRDSGLLHALLGRRSHKEIRASDTIYGHSWEGFCVENLIAAAGSQVMPYFYRSDAGEEIDLVLDFPGGIRWALEMKGPNTKVTRGFEEACSAVGAVRKFVVQPVPESHDQAAYRVMTLLDAMIAARLGPS